jgi:DNA-binding NtrC family response regulator
MTAKANILVVDDEEIVRRAHTRTLAGTRCDVREVLNGQEALDAMAEQPFDLVLLDLRMPGMDGMTVLKAMKQRWPESEVIIITGYPSLETAKEAIRLGAYDYLAKPVPPQEVIEAANGAMNHKRWAVHRESSTGRPNRFLGAQA